MRRIKVLIVDDSKTIRALIRRSLEGHSDLEVTGEAEDPLQARDLIIKDTPDVITLDVEMPGMNGLQFLDKIMRLRPIPVVMVSSLTTRGANTAIKALQMGAFDCYPKPQSSLGADQFAGLAPLVREAARSTPGRRNGACVAASAAAHQVRHQMSGPSWQTNFSVVAIGSSTGGVEALESILSSLPGTSPPIVVCQHMPALFTASFASRLDAAIPALSIAEAKDGEMLAPGMVRIAPGGGRHCTVALSGGRCITNLKFGPPVGGHSPSVDVLFESVASSVGRNALGIILTGMGRDGAEGLLKMRQTGCRTIAQDQASCVVYGMPRAAAAIGAADQIVGLAQIPSVAMNLR
ncbi:protein-glutamate methylesterase/protein-glutamine glutaminase [Acetobacter persici]|uniref:Protein-glutamate methylesterase/protein-glutamine glutaminase n=1 Tax=Acetobacter persici TaxID=1076596 RepID=A0A1U9LJM3_9PROT|nr:chemotaxis response regulator protein-glutamate methylesterase [Acetobacter persici]AQT06621.1 chemotaxis response regulator protein-glutamate methylesterase [Acetobacter persici]